ncbi:MAG: hypothetical protein L0G25_04395 [Psychrobacter sp.]|nr:hypothetical protein [Psychrobacter sp.]
MSTEPEPSEMPTAIQQRKQANQLLLRLQWLLVFLLIIALVWLYISQQRFQNQVNERFQSNEQIVTRLNDMDDRLFANTQPVLPASKAAVGSQAQNQLELLRIQIQATDSLLANNNIKAAVKLLSGLQWQLSQNSNEIAPALTVVIQKSLQEDIERLQALSAQPSPWQLQNLAIQDIQEFLHSHERDNNHERIKSANQAIGTGQNALLTRRQLTIHEVIMTLNLAIQASNMREQDQLISYLSQARTQLQTLTTTETKAKGAAKKANQADRLETDELAKNRLDNMPAPNNIAEVVVWLDRLLASAPTPIPLVTAQVLQQPNNPIN